jgi:zinc transporter 1/2/3
MGCAAPNHDYDVPLRIGLLFVILVTGAIGVFVPILTSRFTNVSMNGTVIVAMRQFGTGVIISTAIVHVRFFYVLAVSRQPLTGYSFSHTPSSSLITTASRASNMRLLQEPS